MNLKNYIWALIASSVGFFFGWYLVYFLTGSTYVGYFAANILASFLYAFISLDSEQRLHFLHSDSFNRLFSTSLCYFFGITLIFIFLGII